LEEITLLEKAMETGVLPSEYNKNEWANNFLLKRM
jgi:hypothetical protein